MSISFPAARVGPALKEEGDRWTTYSGWRTDASGEPVPPVELKARASTVANALTPPDWFTDEMAGALYDYAAGVYFGEAKIGKSEMARRRSAAESVWLVVHAEERVYEVRFGPNMQALVHRDSRETGANANRDDIKELAETLTARMAKSETALAFLVNQIIPLTEKAQDILHTTKTNLNLSNDTYEYLTGAGGSRVITVFDAIATYDMLNGEFPFKTYFKFIKQEGLSLKHARNKGEFRGYLWRCVLLAFGSLVAFNEVIRRWTFMIAITKLVNHKAGFLGAAFGLTLAYTVCGATFYADVEMYNEWKGADVGTRLKETNWVMHLPYSGVYVATNVFNHAVFPLVRSHVAPYEDMAVALSCYAGAWCYSLWAQWLELTFNTRKLLTPMKIFNLEKNSKAIEYYARAESADKHFQAWQAAQAGNSASLRNFKFNACTSSSEEAFVSTIEALADAMCVGERGAEMQACLDRLREQARIKAAEQCLTTYPPIEHCGDPKIVNGVWVSSPSVICATLTILIMSFGAVQTYRVKRKMEYARATEAAAAAASREHAEQIRQRLLPEHDDDGWSWADDDDFEEEDLR